MVLPDGFEARVTSYKEKDSTHMFIRLLKLAQNGAQRHGQLFWNRR